MTTIALLHDPYIDAVTQAIDEAHGLEAKSSWTSAADTVGTRCHLTGLITLDIPATGLEAEWPNGLIIVWEWHSGRDAAHPESGPRWEWAELVGSGCNATTQDLPVEGYASPAAIVTAVRNLLTGDTTTPVTGRWDGSARLDHAATWWGDGE